jgi:hypothetical protein
VLKLTLVNNSLVDKQVRLHSLTFQSFLKVLHRAGINISDPYCQLILIASEQQGVDHALIDYKVFLNVSLKSLSKEHLTFQDFLLELFWDSRIGGGSHQGAKIDVFNQAFYEFFHRDTRIMSVELTERVLNECF